MAHAWREGGFVVALSGVDSSGKSTQRDLLLDALRSAGHEPVTFWSRPGYTPGLEAIKRLVRRVAGREKAPRKERASGSPGRYPRRAASLRHPLRRRLWLGVALLDLLWSYAVRVRIWKRSGRAVICDCYLLDCLVDFRVNFPDDRVEDRLLWRWLRRLSVRPAAAFCLIVPVEVSVARSRAKARFHWEDEDTVARRGREYLAACEELGVEVLDGTLRAEELAQAIERGVARALRGTVVGPGRPVAAGRR